MSSIASSDDDYESSEEEEMPLNPHDELVKELQDKIQKYYLNCCMADDESITIDGLREVTADFSADVVSEAIIKSRLLLDFLESEEHVSLEVVTYLVEELAPESVSSTVALDKNYNRIIVNKPEEGALPLHIACKNQSGCSDSIIKFLFEKYPSAAKNLWQKHGYPLHIYLIRAIPQEAYVDPEDIIEETGEVLYEHPAISGQKLDYDLVKMLVEACPESLITSVQRGYPMSILCQGCSVTLELAKLLSDEGKRCFGVDEAFKDRCVFPPIRHLVGNSHVEHFPIDVLHYFKEYSPSSLRGEEEAPSENDDNPVRLGEENDDWSENDPLRGLFTDSLLHVACSNPKISVEAIQLIIDVCPDMVREEYVHDGFLPIHNLCKNKDLDNGTSIKILKLLVEKYPESVMKNISPQRLPDWYVVVRENDLPIHFACEFKSLEFCRYLVEKYPDCISLRQLHYTGEFEIPGTGSSMFPFHLACKYGGLELVQYLLDRYPSALEEQTSDRDYNDDRRAGEHKRISFSDRISRLLPVGNYPLHLAASREHSSEKIEIMKFLLQKDANAASKIGKYGNSPLHRACWYVSGPDIDVITMLVKAHPAALRQKNAFGQFPIHLAMQTSDESNFDGLTYLAKHNPETLRVADRRGMSCAHYACSSKNALKKLELIAEVCPEAFRCQSETCGLPIHYASKEVCKEEVLKFLIAQYPESLVVHHDVLGSPLHCAAKDSLKGDPGSPWYRVAPRQHAKHKCMRLLLQERYKAALETGIPIVHAFLDDQQILHKDLILKEHPFSHKEKVEEDAMGRTLLHLIFRHTTDTEVIMNLCIFYSSHLSTQDNNGWLPLHHAMRHKASPETIDCMISRGDPEHLLVTNNNGQTPLHVACLWGKPPLRVIYYLSSFRELLPIRDNDERTILHAACDGEASVEVVNYLVDELGFDTAALDCRGDVPLHKACRVGNVPMIEYLMEKDMTAIFARNNFNELPIHLLCSRSGKSEEVLESVEYTGAIFRLLLAWPETVDQASFPVPDIGSISLSEEV